jgi:hypothetical protein
MKFGMINKTRRLSDRRLLVNIFWEPVCASPTGRKGKGFIAPGEVLSEHF